MPRSVDLVARGVTLARRAARSAVAVATRPLEDPAVRARLPLTSAQVGPPRRHAPLAHLADHAGGTSLPVDGARLGGGTALVEPATHWHGDRLAHRAAAPAPVPTVAVLHDARVVLPHGWVIGADDTLVIDSVFGWGEPGTPWVHRLRRARPTVTLPGRTVHLLADFATTNRWHFLFDAVARTALLRAAGVDPADADRVLVPALASDTATWVLHQALADATPYPVAPSHRWPTVRCEELVVTTVPGAGGRFPGWAPAALRSLLASAPAPIAEPSPAHVPPGSPVWLAPREPTPFDTDDLVEALVARGAVVIDPDAGPHAVAAVAAAPVVVGVHGEAMASVAWCRPGAAVVELVTPDAEPAYLGSAAAALGVEHHALVGGPAAQPWDTSAVLAVVDELRRTR